MPSLKELGIDNVIDSHTHSGGTDTYNFFAGNIPHTQSVDDLILKVKIAGVDKVVTTPFPGTSYYNTGILIAENRKEPSGLQDFPYQLENITIARDCERSKEITIPFACIDPTQKVKEQLELIAKLQLNHQIFGIKFHTLASNCTSNELIKSGVAEFAVANNLPILIHSGIDFISHPQNILQVSNSFPNLRMSIAHLAGLDDDVIKEIHKHKNLFIDCAPFLQICRAVDEEAENVSFPNLINPKEPSKSLMNYFEILKDHLIWGTDEPWTTSISATGRVRSNNTYFDEVNVLTELFKISPEAVTQITNKNTIRYLYNS